MMRALWDRIPVRALQGYGGDDPRFAPASVDLRLDGLSHPGNHNGDSPTPLSNDTKAVSSRLQCSVRFGQCAPPASHWEPDGAAGIGLRKSRGTRLRGRNTHRESESREQARSIHRQHGGSRARQTHHGTCTHRSSCTVQPGTISGAGTWNADIGSGIPGRRVCHSLLAG